MEIIKSHFTPSGLGLEIGASYNPIIPKACGANVEIFDYITQEELREKYKNADVDLSKIEPVDYVSDGRSLYDIIGKSERYDYLIASHVIEHIPDTISFLNDCAKFFQLS